MQAAARVAEDLRRVGIGAEVRPVPFKALVSRPTDTGDWHAIVLGFGGNVPPDPALWKNVYRSSGGLHVWNPRQKAPTTPWEKRMDELVGHRPSEQMWCWWNTAFGKVVCAQMLSGSNCLSARKEPLD